MSHSVRFNFQYYGKLAGEPYEINPSLIWWTSTIRSARHGVSRVKIDWANEKGQISKKSKVDVPIAEKEYYRLDDNIWVEVIVMSPTEEGMYVGARAGAAKINMKELQKSVFTSSNGKFKLKLELIMNQLQEFDEPYSKGILKIELKHNESIRIIKNWKFSSEGLYDFTVENEKKVNSLFTLSIMSALFPYSKKASNLGLQYKPTVDIIEGIHAPIWLANVAVPGWMYWVDYSEYEPDETFMENLALISLERHNMKEIEFLRIIDDQFKEMGEPYDVKFNIVVAITMDTIAIPSVSLFYKSDETYVVEEKSNGWLNNSDEVVIRKYSIESFNDPLVMKGDDCEGLGSLNHRVMRILKNGIPDKKGNSYWNKTGGWSNKIVDRMQRIVYWYVSGGALGSVTAARVGGEKKADSPLIINSKEDRNSKLGAHMWQESIPVTQFEELLHRTNRSHEKLVIRQTIYPKWISKLPHTVGEGTGAVYPLLRPISEYSTNPETIQDYEEKLLLIHIVAKKTKYFRMGQIQRLQKMIYTLQDARLSGFYRRTTTFHTDELLKEGFPVTEFVWTQMSQRVSEIKMSSSHNDEKWKWGANMRDKLRYETSNGKKLGLITVPPSTNEEINAIKSLVRQLPPLKTPILLKERKSELEQYALPIIKEFQLKVNSLTAKRTKEIKYNRINVIFRREEFFRGMIDRENNFSLRDGLLEDIRSLESIYKVRTVFETITNEIYNVRIELYINITKEEEEQESTKLGGISTTKNLFGVILNWISQTKENLQEEKYYFQNDRNRNSFIDGIRGIYHKPDFTLGQIKTFNKGHKLFKERTKKGYTALFSFCSTEIEVNPD